MIVMAVRLWGHPERAHDVAESFSVRGAPGWVLTRGVVVVAANFVFLVAAFPGAPLPEGQAAAVTRYSVLLGPCSTSAGTRVAWW